MKERYTCAVPLSFRSSCPMTLFITLGLSLTLVRSISVFLYSSLTNVSNQNSWTNLGALPLWLRLIFICCFSPHSTESNQINFTLNSTRTTFQAARRMLMMFVSFLHIWNRVDDVNEQKLYWMIGKCFRFYFLFLFCFPVNYSLDDGCDLFHFRVCH